MSAISVDDAQLSDLSPAGWLGLGIATLGVGGILYEIGVWLSIGADPIEGLVLGTLATILGLTLAHDNAMPEEEGNCDNCGAHVRTHSSRDTADEVLLVKASGKPRRARIGPLSIALQSQNSEHLYCSGSCAAEDSRVMITGDDHETPTAAEVEDAV